MNKLISAFCILFSLLIASFPVASAASDLSLEDEARQELRKLFAALSSGNPRQVEPLQSALSLAQRNGLKPVFETARMYRGRLAIRV